MPNFKRLYLTDAARADLSEISRHTQAEWGVRQKERYLGQLNASIQSLASFPARGMPRDDITPGLRAVRIARHLIFYREGAEEIWIVRILSERVDPTLQEFD